MSENATPTPESEREKQRKKFLAHMTPCYKEELNHFITVLSRASGLTRDGIKGLLNVIPAPDKSWELKGVNFPGGKLTEDEFKHLYIKATEDMFQNIMNACNFDSVEDLLKRYSRHTMGEHHPYQQQIGLKMDQREKAEKQKKEKEIQGKGKGKERETRPSDEMEF